MIAKVGKFKWAYLLQFFAGFCLIANGAYIGIGSFGKIGDAGDKLLRHGSPIWSLWLFGAVCFPFGLVPLEWPRPALRTWHSRRQSRSSCRLRFLRLAACRP